MPTSPKPTRKAQGRLHDAYPVKTVARLTGLTPDLIRAWERRYGVVEPVRGPRGARLYSRDDVDQLRLLAKLVTGGRAIGDIARLDRPALQSLAEGGLPATDEEDTAPPNRGNAEAIERVLEALSRLDQAEVGTLLGEALLAMGAPAFVRAIGIPLLDRVGERWAHGTASIAEEHLFSGMLRQIFAGLGQMQAPRRPPSAMLAAPSGERHEFGLTLIGLLFLEAGLAVTHLGTDLPADEIVQAAAKTAVPVVGLSLVNSDNQAAAASQLRRIEKQLPSDVELWLGGSAARSAARAVPKSRALVLQDIHEIESHIRRIADAAGGG